MTVSANCGTDVLTLPNLINIEEIPEPVAEFNANPSAGFSSLDVQFNNLSTGNPTSFVWELGDGGISTEENPLYTYKRPGIFTPSLLVSNSSGSDIESKTNLINVQSGEAPISDFNASPLTGSAPLNVQFTDASTGNIDNWSWDFGDGVVSTLQNPNHDYLNPGFYNVKLIVSGADGTGSEKKVNLINVLEGEEPTAAFFAEPLTGNAPFIVHFFDTSGGDVTNFVWDFGDGNTSTNKNPVHKHENTDIFTVKLTVSNNDGTDTETKTNLIIVENGVEPSAGFVIDNSEIGENGTDTETNLIIVQNGAELSAGFAIDNSNIGENSNTFEFKDISSSPDEKIMKREWDFGDGTKSEEEEPEHTYMGTEGDTFTVSLTIQNAEGLDTVTKPAFVSIEPTIIPGFIKGLVTDKNTGEVITGAVISISFDIDSDITSVETTTDGSYFIQLAPKDYTLSIKKDGFQEFTKDIIINESETETVDIEMVTGNEEVDGNLAVKPVTAIGTVMRLTAIVTVTDGEGEPVSDVIVEASASQGSKVNPPLRKTDENGEAKFRFKFNRNSSDGVIRFVSENFGEVTITQE